MLNLDVLYFLVGLTTAYIDDDDMDQITRAAEAMTAEHDVAPQDDEPYVDIGI